MILILLNLIYVIFWVYILMYLYKLEKLGCECSKGWQKTFITYFVVYLLIILGLGTRNLSPFLLTLNYILMIFFIITVHQYIHRLKKQKCECSTHVARDILEIVNNIQIVLVALTLFIIIYSMFAVSKFLKDNQINNKDIKSISTFISKLGKSKTHSKS